MSKVARNNGIFLKERSSLLKESQQSTESSHTGIPGSTTTHSLLETIRLQEIRHKRIINNQPNVRNNTCRVCNTTHAKKDFVCKKI